MKESLILLSIKTFKKIINLIKNYFKIIDEVMDDGTWQATCYFFGKRDQFSSTKWQDIVFCLSILVAMSRDSSTNKNIFYIFPFRVSIKYTLNYTHLSCMTHGKKNYTRRTGAVSKVGTKAKIPARHLSYPL